MPEQIRIINEDRQSGLTDTDWCRENGVADEEMYLDNSHTIEIGVKDITIRICNDAEPTLLTRTFQMLWESLC